MWLCTSFPPRQRDNPLQPCKWHTHMESKSGQHGNTSLTHSWKHTDRPSIVGSSGFEGKPQQPSEWRLCGNTAANPTKKRVPELLALCYPGCIKVFRIPCCGFKALLIPLQSRHSSSKAHPILIRQAMGAAGPGMANDVQLLCCGFVSLSPPPLQGGLWSLAHSNCSVGCSLIPGLCLGKDNMDNEFSLYFIWVCDCALEGGRKYWNMLVLLEKEEGGSNLHYSADSVKVGMQNGPWLLWESVPD